MKYTGCMSRGNFRDWSSKRRKGKAEPTVVQGTHDAIIDMELWDKVQTVNKMKSENRISQSNFAGEFILSGLLRCPVCGAGTVMSKSKKRDGSGYHLYYMYQTFHSKGKTECGSNLIRKEHIEEQVLEFVQKILAEDQIVSGILERLKGEDAQGTLSLEKDLDIQRGSLRNAR